MRGKLSEKNEAINSWENNNNSNEKELLVSRTSSILSSPKYMKSNLPAEKAISLSGCRATPWAVVVGSSARPTVNYPRENRPNLSRRRTKVKSEVVGCLFAFAPPPSLVFFSNKYVDLFTRKNSVVFIKKRPNVQMMDEEVRQLFRLMALASKAPSRR